MVRFLNENIDSSAILYNAQYDNTRIIILLTL